MLLSQPGLRESNQLGGFRLAWLCLGIVWEAFAFFHCYLLIGVDDAGPLQNLRHPHLSSKSRLSKKLSALSAPTNFPSSEARFHRWLASLAGRQVCVLEIGCGSSEHSLRMRWTENSWCCMSGEWKIPRLACPLVRLDPGEAEEVEEGHLGNLVHLLLGARDALEQLSVELGGATRADAVE